MQQAILVGHSAGALTAMELFKRCVTGLPVLLVNPFNVCKFTVVLSVVPVTTMQVAGEVLAFFAAYCTVSHRFAAFLWVELAQFWRRASSTHRIEDTYSVLCRLCDVTNSLYPEEDHC